VQKNVLQCRLFQQVKRRNFIKSTRLSVNI